MADTAMVGMYVVNCSAFGNTVTITVGVAVGAKVVSTRLISPGVARTGVAAVGAKVVRTNARVVGVASLGVRTVGANVASVRALVVGVAVTARAPQELPHASPQLFPQAEGIYTGPHGSPSVPAPSTSMLFTCLTLTLAMMAVPFHSTTP
jgi:hypothetical protein